MDVITKELNSKLIKKAQNIYFLNYSIFMHFIFFLILKIANK